MLDITNKLHWDLLPPSDTLIARTSSLYFGLRLFL